MKHKRDLAGSRAVVTGASSGIGLCFCKTLASRGCSLVMISNQSKELDECASQIAEEYGVETYPYFCDLTQEGITEQIIDWIEQMGLEVDILINNAGIFSFAPVIETSQRKIDCFIDLHIRAVTELTKGFAQKFVSEGRGRILNMSSMSCWTPMPGIALYSATKAYIRAFSRAMHYELRDSGVSLTVACPGGIATDLFGLPANLMKLAVAIKAVQTPEKFTAKAIDKMLKGKMQYINGLINRMAIVFVGMMPTGVRMLIKRKMLDKGIRR